MGADGPETFRLYTISRRSWLLADPLWPGEAVDLATGKACSALSLERSLWQTSRLRLVTLTHSDGMPDGRSDVAWRSRVEEGGRGGVW